MLHYNRMTGSSGAVATATAASDGHGEDTKIDPIELLMFALCVNIFSTALMNAVDLLKLLR